MAEVAEADIDAHVARLNALMARVKRHLAMGRPLCVRVEGRIYTLSDKEALTLYEFLWAKPKGVSARLRGRMDAALDFETKAERAYRRLPHALRW